MQAIGIIGYKNSGKTELAVKLSQSLAQRGYSVAGLKLSHHSFERQGSDTDRLARHMDPVFGINPGESLLKSSRFISVQDTLFKLNNDFVIIEGGKSLGYFPKILALRDREDIKSLDNTLALAYWSMYGQIQGVQCQTDLDKLADLIVEKSFLLPGLNCGACGRETCQDLAAEIIQGKAEINHCKSLDENFKILVNGQEIPLNPFAKSMISGGILGMLKSLKGFSKGRVEITLEPENE